jgi:DNA-binding transcriptional ArsR family regulator
MATAKTEEFAKVEVDIAEIAKALSHPARIKILKILNDLNSCMVGSIVDLLPLSQSTVSQHLKELKRVGLIKGEIEGPKICYCINPKVMERVKNEFNKLFSQVCKC